MKHEKLPRGLRRRGNSLVVTFALADGTIERRALGPVSVQWAKEQREIFRREVREGTYEKRQPATPKRTFTVGDLWDAYLREYRNQGKRNADRLEIAWNHLKVMFDTKRVEEISTDSINQYIEKRRADGVQNGTINRETATLSAMFNHGTRVTPPTVDRVPAFPRRLKESPPLEKDSSRTLNTRSWRRIRQKLFGYALSLRVLIVLASGRASCSISECARWTCSTVGLTSKAMAQKTVKLEKFL